MQSPAMHLARDCSERVSVTPGRKEHQVIGRMKLLIVTPFPPNQRGESDFAGGMVSCLASLDEVEEVVVVTHGDDFPIGTRVEEPGLAKVRVARTLSVRSPAVCFGGLAMIPLVRREHPTVLHIYAPLSPKLYGGALGEPLIPLLAACRIFGVPTY